MKVSYKWLSQYVDLSGVPASELAERMPRTGVEVDAVESRNQGVEGVVVGYVKERSKHPDADKLSVCVVDVGGEQDLQIVCGAKNIDAGQKVPVAVVGANLPDGLRIKRAKLRGVESQGMICSAKELGLNDRLLPKEIQEGILVLPADTQIGASILEVLDIDDEVLELDLTPNRSDCLSMLGVAYEAAAILNRGVRLPDEREGLSESASRAAERIQVSIAATEACSHYSARLVEGVTVGSSPLWLQNRLMSAGIRPINNVVDVTNFVMLEYGQPLHAFDADRIAGGRIEVRFAEEGERLVTLDGQERALTASMLLITDGERRPVAIAGVMGGRDTEVTSDTKRILLESARFDGGTVRKTSRQLGLRSEASLRFEKNVNPDAVIPALDRAASLLCLLAGGQAAEGIVEARTEGSAPVELAITLTKVNGYLGTSLTKDEAAGIFQRLHFVCEQQEVSGDASFRVHVPNRRGDITRDVDLIEEIARLYGYDEIPVTRIEGVTTPGSLTREQRIRRYVRGLLSDSGLNEAVSYSFTHPSQMTQFAGRYPDAHPVALALPMNEERSVLRTSLIPHLMDTAAYNRNRSTMDIAMFEIGRVYLGQEEKLSRQPEERTLLSILWTGNRNPASWTGKPGRVDFYDLKGILEKLFEGLGVSSLVQYRSAAPAGFHPGRTAELVLQTSEGDVSFGTIGQLHPTLQQAKDLEDTFVAELELDTLSRYAEFAITYQTLPRYPSMTRDLAVVVSSEVTVDALKRVIRAAAGELLKSVSVFDVFTGERLGANRKSVALSMIFRHQDRTLTDEEVSAAHAGIVSALEQTFEAELRK